MAGLAPIFLLDQIASEAPWCVTLDNLELGILLLAQPWAAGTGLRRADLERQLAQLDLPVGPLYFQRVKRAVARLEEIGALRGLGEGRARSFVATPEGLAALLLNLGILRADPTLDGSEFELKRSLVAMLSLLFERLSERPDEGEQAPETARFFADLEDLTLLGQPVIGEEVEARAFDILGLIAEQRTLVERLLAGARQRLESGLFPRVGQAAAVLRYEKYLGYLDELATLYAAELKTVGFQSFRSSRRPR